ncbi:DNA-directed RNA polymerase subunit beta [Paenibacillus sp. EC2-1]
MVPIFLLLALVGGMVVGYVVLGKQDIGEAFQWSTWKHVFDLVFAP